MVIFCVLTFPVGKPASDHTMKKFLGILTLTFLLSLSARAVELEAYCSGAWWDLRVATFNVRGASELRVWRYTDNTVISEIWFDGVLLKTGYGTWSSTRNLFRKTLVVTLPGGITLKGTLNTFNGVGTGTYKGGGDTGRWQLLEL